MPISSKVFPLLRVSALVTAVGAVLSYLVGHTPFSLLVFSGVTLGAFFVVIHGLQRQKPWALTLFFLQLLLEVLTLVLGHYSVAPPFEALAGGLSLVLESRAAYLMLPLWSADSKQQP